MADFEWYRSFVAIYQAGTISAAAEERGMTQPALSHHLMALEQAVGKPLFERRPRQMVPTAEGQALYARVIGPVEQLNSATLRLSGRRARQSLVIRLGIPREFFQKVLMERLKGALSGEERLHLVPGETPGLLKRLQAHDLDAVIATQQVPVRGLAYDLVMEEQFWLVGPPDWGKPLDEPLEEWLLELPWLAYAPNLPIIRRYWQAVFGTRPSITPRLVVPDLQILLRAVEMGLGVSVLPDYLCQESLKNGRILRLYDPPTPPEPNRLYLTYARDQAARPEIEWLRTRLLRTG
jgi:DNA-binding transcriptional LysR family regulator